MYVDALKRIAWLLVAVLAVALLGACTDSSLGATAATSGSSSAENTDSGVRSISSSDDHAAANDVEIVGCSHNEFGGTINVRITNHSSKRSNYILSANFEDAAGNKIGEAIGASNNVEPGQTALEEMVGTHSGASGGKCVMKDVTRYAS